LLGIFIPYSTLSIRQLQVFISPAVILPAASSSSPPQIFPSRRSSAWISQAAALVWDKIPLPSLSSSPLRQLPRRPSPCSRPTSPQPRRPLFLPAGRLPLQSCARPAPLPPPWPAPPSAPLLGSPSHGAPLLDCPSSPRSARAPSRCPSAPSARLANFCSDPPQPRPWPPARISPEPEQSSVHDRRRVPDARSAEWLPRASSLSPRLAPSPNSHGARPPISISLTAPCSLLHELSRVLCRAELAPDPCLSRSCAPSSCCSLCACGPLPPARSRFLGSPWSLRARFCPVRVPLARPRGTSYMAAVCRRVPTRALSPGVAFHSPKPEFASRPCLPVCCCSSLDLTQVAAMVVRCLARADSRSLISPSSCCRW
jgi:hypothetical protein